MPRWSVGPSPAMGCRYGYSTVGNRYGIHIHRVVDPVQVLAVVNEQIIMAGTRAKFNSDYLRLVMVTYQRIQTLSLLVTRGIVDM